MADFIVYELCADAMTQRNIGATNEEFEFLQDLLQRFAIERTYESWEDYHKCNKLNYLNCRRSR